PATDRERGRGDVTAPARVPRRWHALARPRSLAAALGLAAITAYLAIALSRLGYPFVFDRLESNSLIEVRRILAGQQLYPAPTVRYVPDGYPPLYFTAAAPVAS